LRAASLSALRAIKRCRKSTPQIVSEEVTNGSFTGTGLRDQVDRLPRQVEQPMRVEEEDNGGCELDLLLS
jgi:hypothetical protein